jgi:hypothetical protein
MKLPEAHCQAEGAQAEQESNIGQERAEIRVALANSRGDWGSSGLSFGASGVSAVHQRRRPIANSQAFRAPRHAVATRAGRTDCLHWLNHHVGLFCHFVLLSAPPSPNEVESLVKCDQARRMIGERNLESPSVLELWAWGVVVAPAQT